MANRITTWLRRFEAALTSRDVPSTLDLFDADECFWRDLVSFTWNLYTAESREDIHAMLEATLHRTNPSQWALDGPAEEDEDGGLLQAFITFETQIGRGRGHVKLRGDRCWCLLTSMVELKGFEEKAGQRREHGVQHGAVRGRKTWLDSRVQEIDELGKTRQPHCLIVGGGQAGIVLGARLRRICVPTIVIEKNERPGDSWRHRYKSLCLHDPVWYDHLPYLPFPSQWPVFSPKDKMGDWLEAYAKIMEVVYWGSTECKSAIFDASNCTWEVLVQRGGEELRLHPKELILATGLSGFPNIPRFLGSESFQGLQCHSSEYKGSEHCKGKHCVVIGSNNSAHDICAEMWENEAAEVTMVQRSSTMVSPAEIILKEGIGEYHENPRYCVDDADVLLASIPYKLAHKNAITRCKVLQQMYAEFYKRLRDCGFMLDFGDDGSGVRLKYLREASGYYIDVGASELVIRGDIKLKTAVEVTEVKQKSVVFSDGIELKADVIVYATGYGSMNEWAAKLISQEVAGKVGKCWGLGSGTTKDPGPWEQELRNMWKPTRQASLWFHGGNLQQVRYYSLFLALQLKARMEGIRTPVYGLAKVHHTS